MKPVGPKDATGRNPSELDYPTPHFAPLSVSFILKRREVFLLKIIPLDLGPFLYLFILSIALASPCLVYSNSLLNCTFNLSSWENNWGTSNLRASVTVHIFVCLWNPDGLFFYVFSFISYSSALRQSFKLMRCEQVIKNMTLFSLRVWGGAWAARASLPVIWSCKRLFHLIQYAYKFYHFLCAVRSESLESDAFRPVLQICPISPDKSLNLPVFFSCISSRSSALGIL